MRIVFMGTPDFAVPSLEEIHRAGHELCGVYCQSDKPKGRGHKLQAPAVKLAAQSLGLPIYQPAKLRDEAVLEEIRRLAPDCIVVVAYGKLLPKAVLDIPKYGCINVHGSLLPRYRGAAPIQWAVINGDARTGITTMYMAEGLDTGDIILQAETEIAPQETAGELFDRLKALGAELLLRTLELIGEGKAPRTPQDDALACLAPMLKKQEGEINWELPAVRIHNLIRGMNPWPGAYTHYSGKKLKIHKAEITERSGTPGALRSDDGKLLVFCGEQALNLLEIQAENGKRMDGRSFLLGHPLEAEARFVSKTEDG